MSKSSFKPLGWAAAITAAGAFVVATATLALGAVSATGTPAPDRPQILKSAMRYSQAAKQLPQEILNRATGITSTKEARMLTEDETAWVDVTGSLYFVEPPLPAELRADSSPHSTSEVLASASQFIGATISTDDAFNLNSRVGSQRTIFIDFDGMTLSGTAWNDGSYAVPAGKEMPAFDIDGNTTTFTVEERTRIISIWQRVAEDYSMFDVNVTTADPGKAAIERVDANDQFFGARAVVTSLNDTIAVECTCGGIAYIDVFDRAGTSSYGHDYYQPAFAFQRGVGDSAKNLAEVVSHEVGHNLGLTHDGLTAAAPGGAQGYYSGQGSWAPIMGVGYYKPIVQWSSGEYSYSDNPQDDIAVMLSNGVSNVADDYGDTSGAAHSLATGAVSIEGQITTRDDFDYFTFTTAGGYLDITASVASNSPNLDVELKLLNSSSTVLQIDNPVVESIDSDRASGLGARITATLSAGTYYLRVDGVGEGTASATGFSDYASLGRYSLSGSIPAAAPPTITSVTPLEVAVGEKVTVTGTGLDTVTAVTLNSTSASFTIKSATQIEVTVPVGSSSGAVSVTNPSGTATSSETVSVYQGRTAFNLTLQNQNSAQDRVGDLLTADVSALSPTDATLQYQWLRAGSVISGATAASYRLSTDDLGLKISVRVTASKPTFMGATQTSLESLAVSGGSFTAPSQVVIEGNLQVGETLSAAFDAIPNPLPTGVTYLWVNVQTSETLYLGPSNTYQLKNSDAGGSIRVYAYLTCDFYDELSLESASSEMVTGGTISPVSLTIKGTARFAQTLSIDSLSWDVPSVANSYQWLRDGAEISGAKSASYQLQLSDIGRKISVRVTATKNGFSSATNVSAQTELVAKGLQSGGSIVRNEKFNVGETDSVTLSPPSAGGTPSCTWKSGSTLRSTSCSSALLSNNMLGQTLDFQVVYSAAGYEDFEMTAPGTSVVTNGILAPSVTFDSSDAFFGGTLALTNFNWDGATATISWWRGSEEIVEARGQLDYQPVLNDVGKTVSVRITLFRSLYLSKQLEYSALISQATQTSGAVSVSGTPRLGQSLTATASGFTLAGGSLEYQWFADNSPIASATETSYLLKLEDLGSRISVKVTSRVAGYEDRIVSAAASALVSGGQNTLGTVAVSGTAKVSKTLKAKLAQWVAGTTFSYQWLRNGKSISKATKSSYKLTSSDKGKKISLRITAKAAHYDTRTLSSTSTATVK